MNHRLLWIASLTFLLNPVTPAWSAQTAPAGGGAPSLSAATEATESCLSCHGSQMHDSIRFADGSSRKVNIDRGSWLKSVHGNKLACTDCHREISGYPHRKTKYQDSRDYTLARANTCQRCHYAHYTRVLDSMHYEVQKAGMREAPTCVDCHGSHAIHDPKQPRLSITEKCAGCHSDVAETYKKSVHGKALSDGNQDVPVCTDCHGAHAIGDPTKTEFKVNSYKMCSQCHSDAEKMGKYGLNPAVLTTYLDDFHGASNKLYSMGAGRPTKLIATCTDCHGVHNIASFKAKGNDAKAKAEARERVVNSCRQCHAGVTPSFADAWLSHYPPTLERAPLVWIVKVAYQILIPMILAGLVLHILLHLWRLRTHR